MVVAVITEFFSGTIGTINAALFSNRLRRRHDQTVRECDESPPPRLLEGIAQFNRGEYFVQHETLELLWSAQPREVATSIIGIPAGRYTR
jgi:hypothetical protein